MLEEASRGRDAPPSQLLGPVESKDDGGLKSGRGFLVGRWKWVKTRIKRGEKWWFHIISSWKMVKLGGFTMKNWDLSHELRKWRQKIQILGFLDAIMIHYGVIGFSVNWSDAKISFYPYLVIDPSGYHPL